MSTLKPDHKNFTVGLSYSGRSPTRLNEFKSLITHGFFDMARDLHDPGQKMTVQLQDLVIRRRK